MRDARSLAAPLVLLLALAVMLNFVDRGAIGIAGPVMSKALGLSPAGFGLAASAFFLTYGLSQPFIGRAADRFPAARVLALSVTLWALATLLTAFAHGIGALIALRLALGLGEAALFPCTSKLIAGHVPAERRGIANAMIATGLAIGPALGTAAGGYLLVRGGWHAVFGVFGVVTLVWVLPWLIVSGRAGPGHLAAAGAPTPLRALVSRPALWLMGSAHALANYGFFFVSIWLPLYLVTARGLSLPTMTLFATATYAAQALASLGWGHMADRLVAGGMNPARAKRMLCVIAELGQVAGIAGIALAPGPGTLLAALVMTGVFLGCLPTMVYALGQIYAGPRDAAGWIGVQNAIGSVSGIIGPLVTGFIVGATGSFAGAFAFAAAVSAAGAVMFAVALP